MNNQDFAQRASKAYGAARENDYLRKLVEDEDLRENLTDAFRAARNAYTRFSDSPTFDTATGDRKVKRELSNAAEALKDAAERIREPKKKRHPVRNMVALGLLSGGLVLVFSESARKAVLDTVFGEEEEFVYSSATTESSLRTNGSPVGDQ
jgi:adenylosuccinate synthase